jgi:hypothetical protein
MKSPNTFFALLGFNLRLLPRFILPLLVIFCLNASTPALLAIVFRAKPWVWEDSGIGTAISSFPIMFCGLIGIQFFVRETGWTGTASTWLMPAGEFLLTHPISRRTAYLSRMLLYFVFLLLPSLLNVSATLAEPNLRISLYHSKTQSTEGSDKLTLYRAEFPDSSLIAAPKGGSDTLIIPFGAVIIALWNFWLAILLALALQACTLLTIPPKLQIGLFMTISLAPMFMIALPVFGAPTMMLENGFFFFAHHCFLFALFTLAAFIFVQQMAINRIEGLDLI